MALDQPVIYMSVYLKTDPSSEKTPFPILNTILIERNLFVDNPGAIAYACSAGNVVIRDNVVRNPTPRAVNFPYRGSIGTAYATGVDVVNNVFWASPSMPRPGLFDDVETTTGVHFEGNALKKP
ncbi:MAG: hypothetical protein J0L75_10635 [Spirochaetes bacterium]|nr:hypothetical protein [Spirochaetota bacterium]